MSEKKAVDAVVEDEVVVGEKLSKEYIAKVDFKKSAEVKMVLYVVPIALLFLLVAYFMNAAK